MVKTPGKTARIHARLPIFRLDEGGETVLYVPGHAYRATDSLARDVERALAGDECASPRARALAEELKRDGRAAAAAWHDLGTRPFEPECLTLYLSNRCNLACGYCYSAPAAGAPAWLRSRPEREPVLAESVVIAAARRVAGHCARKARPLTLVMHGGGEPTLHWELLQRVWDLVATAADETGVGLWSYVATHGVVAAARIGWLAGHFDLIGLSCDGPAGIQNANRPAAGGRATAAEVERTARVLRDHGADYTVRSTITAETVALQTEIVEYLCDVLFARTVRFEPVYDARRSLGRHFRPEDAEGFVSHFLEARRAAQQRGCDLQLSGVRVNEIHGPFCNPLREVLQLTPDGKASACFLSVGDGDALDDPLVMGRLDPVDGTFQIDVDRVAAQRRQAATVPARCEQCHNIYHCARDCPDVCLLQEEPAPEPHGGFRCRVQELLGRRDVFELAAAADSRARVEACGDPTRRPTLDAGTHTLHLAERLE